VPPARPYGIIFALDSIISIISWQCTKMVTVGFLAIGILVPAIFLLIVYIFSSAWRFFVGLFVYHWFYYRYWWVPYPFDLAMKDTIGRLCIPLLKEHNSDDRMMEHRHWWDWNKCSGSNNGWKSSTGGKADYVSTLRSSLIFYIELLTILKGQRTDATMELYSFAIINPYRRYRDYKSYHDII
jgi:hypothetical protein